MRPAAPFVWRDDQFGLDEPADLPTQNDPDDPAGVGRGAKSEPRLSSLHPATTDRLKARRPYPPVVPKYANPDEPSQVWSGRGKRPR
jgi:hypothetical protein